VSFSKDITENLRIDLISLGERAVVEMPLVLVKEGKDLLEGRIGNLNIWVITLNVVLRENAAVEVGMFFPMILVSSAGRS